MTSTDPETRQIDSSRVDDGYRQWPQVLLALVVGIALGALLGAGYGASRPATHEASTALSVQPDPTVDITSQNNNQNSTPSLDATAYIQSQLVVINGRQLADQVRDALGLGAKPDIAATQVGQTYVVQIVATAGSASGAAAVARQTGAQYIAVRTGQLRTQIDGLLTSTNQQLAGVSRSLTASQRGRSSTAAPTPSQTALQTEYERLLSVRSTLNAVLEQAGRVVTVVSPARATSATLSKTTKDALGGAVLGAVLALAGFLALRRSRHRVRSLADLAALDVPVVLPVLPRQAGTEARVLAARLAAEARSHRRPLVFVGPDTRAGTASVAGSVAAALVGGGPVLFVQAPAEPAADEAWMPPASETSPSWFEDAGVVRTSVPGVWLLDDTRPMVADRLLSLLNEVTLLGWQVIVDAGAVSHSDAAIRYARAGAAVVLVVDRGRSTPSAVLSATELFEASGADLLGVVLADPGGPVARLRSRRPASVSPSSGRHAGAALLTSVPSPEAGPGTGSPHPEMRVGHRAGLTRPTAR